VGGVETASGGFENGIDLRENTQADFIETARAVIIDAERSDGRMDQMDYQNVHDSGLDTWVKKRRQTTTNEGSKVREAPQHVDKSS
jgi:hypothetical protein